MLAVAPTNVRIAELSAFPPYVPVEPSPERAAEIRLGRGYAERRCFIEAQWHDSEHLDVDNMRHIHVGAAVPSLVRSRVIQFDIFNLAFHFQGGLFEGIRDFTVRTNTPPTQKWMPLYLQTTDPKAIGRRQDRIPDGADGHLLRWWTPAFIGVAPALLPGAYKFEIDSQTRRPDGRVANVRMTWRTFIDLTGTAKPTEGGKLEFEGWVSPAAGEATQFGYLAVSLSGVRRYVSDPSKPITITAQAKVGRSVRLMLCKNADLHQHPAFYGDVLYDQTFIAETRNFEVTVPAPALVAGDRLMVRSVDANDPDIGSGATLGVVTLAEG